MKVNIERLPGGLKMTARIKGPLTEGQKRWLEFQFCQLRDCDMERNNAWQVIPDEDFVTSRELTGLQGWDGAIFWLKQTPDTIQRRREIEAKLRLEGHRGFSTENDVELLPLELFLDNEPTSLEQLQKFYEAMPDVTFDLGEFKLAQPKVLVSDPCYEPGTWCTGTFEALPGAWTAQILMGPTDWYARVKQLRIRHESIPSNVFERFEDFEDSGISAGVDSGQCGFFDADAYAIAFGRGDSWYDAVCKLTLDTRSGGGISPEGAGAVSQSGFGDGGYGVRVLKKDGLVVAAVLVFVGQEEDEEDEDEDEDPEQTQAA